MKKEMAHMQVQAEERQDTWQKELAGHLATINELQAELAKAQTKQFELEMVDSDQDVKSEEFVSETPVIRMDASLKPVDIKLGLAQSDSEIEEDSFTKSELIIVNEDKPSENENYEVNLYDQVANQVERVAQLEEENAQLTARILEQAEEVEQLQT